MARHAEARGEIKPGDTLIEPTSGNTGIALAMAAAIRGYPLVRIMPALLAAQRTQHARAPLGRAPQDDAGLRRRDHPDAAEGRDGGRARPRREDGAPGQGHDAR